MSYRQRTVAAKGSNQKTTRVSLAKAHNADSSVVWRSGSGVAGHMPFDWSSVWRMRLVDGHHQCSGETGAARAAHSLYQQAAIASDAMVWRLSSLATSALGRFEQQRVVTLAAEPTIVR
jgi:hypothetical protein